MSIGIDSYRDKNKETVEWFTPLSLTQSLGQFDLDPCTNINRPWDTATKYYTISDDGLASSWSGRVWLNPPYGRETRKWVRKLSEHGNGIALIFARVETNLFFDYVWTKAQSILFIKGRIQFCSLDGSIARSNGGAPSVLIAYGDNNTVALKESGIEGKLILL